MKNQTWSHHDDGGVVCALVPCVNMLLKEPHTAAQEVKQSSIKHAVGGSIPGCSCYVLKCL